MDRAPAKRPDHRGAAVGCRAPPGQCGNADPLFAAGSQVTAAAALVDKAIAALGAGDLDAAEAACQQALALDAQQADALHIAGHIAGRRGQREQALALVEQAIALVPNHPQYHYNMAVSLGEMGRENEAALHYQACLRQRPHHGDALWNYGEMLRMAEHFERAAELFLRFEAGGGNYPALHHRLAVCMGALGRDAEAAARFARELANPGHDPLTRWEHALHLLSRERFAEGFAQYRHRFACGGRNSVFCHDFGLPSWQGRFDVASGGSGRTLLVHGEQGLGDEMMFASVLPELLADAQAAGARVVLAVKPPLVRLFAASFPQATVCPHKVGVAVADLAGLRRIDWQVAIGDLPHFYRKTEADFASAARPYLRADPARTGWYARQLALQEPPGAPAPRLRVGIMWGSNPAAHNAKFMRWTQQRSIPVHMFERLVHRVPEVRFVSLQNHERGAEAALAPGLDILDFSALQTDFAETAALIGALDLVISVDTSVSHLAGGLGKPCWVPLMKRPDWRHGLVRDHSLWYSGTRYFRQSVQHQWDDVLDRIDTALAELLAVAPVRVPLLPAETADGSAAMRPDRPELAQALALLGARDLPAARQWFDRALAREPDSPAVQWEAAMEALTAGDWARGWDLHEARL
ncbi:MAG: tetratricopeptide repeat protein, partial [Variovorax sp.]